MLGELVKMIQDTRPLHKRNKNNNPIQFYHFPGLYDRQKGDIKWIIVCHWDDNFVCTKDSYICSLHFIGNNGTTKANPDPVYCK
jgi:hypothetical protein